MNTIDLHMHSIASADGEFTPEELVNQAKEAGIKIMAIADHDGVSSIEKALYHAKQNNIICIPATEICAEMDDGTGIHILGYNIDYKDQRYIDREKYVKSLYVKYSDAYMNKALSVGFKFNKEDVLKVAVDNIVTEEMIGEAILSDSRNDNDSRLLEYRPGGNKSDNPGFNFYKEFCHQGGLCYVESKGVNMPLSEASELIHSTGGFMVLAHPGHNIKHDVDKLTKIMEYGLDGIEVFSSYHNKQDTDFYNQKADLFGLIKTVGSDYHGKCKPAVKMGSIDYIEEDVQNGLKKFKII
ncbi:MAG: PHP domain-containing protein [Erysipelotrichaceae bacterium]|nr:PHP domain-containing protein [Erysipelotrichaceae bacterium]